MVVQICFTLSALLLIIALHPFVTYPLSLSLLTRRRAHPDDGTTPAHGESFAMCVCAYNEEASIERKVENMLALRRRLGSLEILIYVDASTDRTAEIVEQYRDEVILIASRERHGKVHGMNVLVEHARASILVFTDANVILEETAIEALARAFRDPRVGCVCGHLVYVNAEEMPTAAVGSFYWRLEERIKDRESAAGAVAFEKSVTATGEEFLRKVRIACQAFNGHRVLWPRLRRLPPTLLYMYVSHKLLRWLSIYSLALSGISVAAGLSALGVPLGATELAALALLILLWWGAARALPPFAQLREVLLALLGAGIGVVQALRGERFQTWTPASSIRR